MLAAIAGLVPFVSNDIVALGATASLLVTAVIEYVALRQRTTVVA
jgi:low temperature requirement protein LtrA